MLRIIRGAGHDDRNATFDTVVLADGQIMTVPRADLAAAKAVFAAQKAALRRVAAQNYGDYTPSATGGRRARRGQPRQAASASPRVSYSP